MVRYDWQKLETFFVLLLLRDGYEQIAAQELGFAIRQILEDSAPLMLVMEDDRGQDSSDEAVLEQLHMLFNNKELFSKGYHLLMRGSLEASSS